MPVNSFDDYFMSWRPKVSQLSRPYYLSLANLLEEEIVSGRLAAGTRLPPQRELGDFLDLNFTTVTRAYNLCREKGLIYGTTGRGTFVSPQGGIEGEGGTGVIELGVVSGFNHVLSEVHEAMVAVVQKGYLEKLYTYSDPGGHRHQRAAGAHWMSLAGVEVDCDHTAVFSGAQNVISAALLSLFKLGDRIAVDEFTYANLLGASRLFHIQLVPVVGDDCGMDPAALEHACQQGRLSGIFLMPNCANPTTVTMPEERRDELARIIAQGDLILLEDDIRGERQALSGSRPMFARLPEQTVYISRPDLCCGLRAVFGAFPERFRQRLLNGLFHLNIKSSVLDGEVVTELIMSGKAKTILDKKDALARSANRLVDEVLPGRCAPAAEESKFRWLDLGEGELRDGIEIERLLRERGVSVHHSYRYAASPRHPGHHLRLSVSSAGSEDRLRRGLELVRDFLS